MKSSQGVPATPDDRSAVLFQARNLKMARGRATPEGPPVWIGGDCHVGNPGPVANAGGKIEIQIRDLDQTVIGNADSDEGGHLFQSDPGHHSNLMAAR